MRRGACAVLAIAVVLAGAGCGAHAVRPFRDRPITWRDPDLVPWGPAPPAERSRAMWDAADGLVFRQAIRALDVEPPAEAVDVNALDEVPSSSFFTNRIGVAAMSPDEVARGACAPDQLPLPPLTVIEPKRDGAQPGFLVRDATGARWLIKTDGTLQPERSTAADTIVAALLHAAGYHVPCNRVIAIAPGDLVLADGVDPDDVAAVLAAATPLDGARVRASASAFLPGTPLGPWSSEGRWERDRRDRVPHELRREVRALRVFAAWVDHVDARAHNTLAIWIDEGGGRGHVEHALIDFGDSLGATSTSERRAARYGHAHWVSIGMALEDVAMLGFLPRPWHEELPAPDPVLGDFEHETFDPARWHANYAHGAFERMDETDAAWAARIVARFERDHLRALARLGRFRSRATEDALVRALAARRIAILERWLHARSPLARPVIAGERLCLEDVAVSAGIRDAAERVDGARTLEGRALETAREGARVCVALPGARYAVIDVESATPGLDRARPARVHVIDRARVIGLERPERR